MRDGTRRPPTSRSNGPPFADRLIFGGRPVSPLKNTTCRSERMTSEDHNVALRVVRRVLRNACDGAAVTVSSLWVLVAIPTNRARRCGRAARPRLRGARRRRETSANGTSRLAMRGRSGNRGDRSDRARRSRDRGIARRGIERVGTAWDRRAARRGARTPHRIREHAAAVHFNQHRGMAEPGNPVVHWRAVWPRCPAGSSTAAHRDGAARRRKETRRSSASMRSDRASPG